MDILKCNMGQIKEYMKWITVYRKWLKHLQNHKVETGSQKDNKAKNKTKQKKRIHEDQKRYKIQYETSKWFTKI